eukprot:scaffold13933_cov219-Amphora_coffeaeformis.AAC.13
MEPEGTIRRTRPKAKRFVLFLCLSTFNPMTTCFSLAICKRFCINHSRVQNVDHVYSKDAAESEPSEFKDRPDSRP